jgi:hypothetical protein
MICTIGELNRGVTKSLLNPVLPTFTEALVSSLNLPDDSHLSDVGLKTEVLKGQLMKYPLEIILLQTVKRESLSFRRGFIRKKRRFPNHNVVKNVAKVEQFLQSFFLKFSRCGPDLTIEIL